ncbi:MAG: NusG domain II-containing protein [Eubacteriales bacterium]
MSLRKSDAKRSRRLRFAVGDIIAAAAVLTAAFAMLLFMLAKPSGTTAEVVSPDGVHTISLAVDGVYTFTGNGYTMTAEVAGGSVRAAECSCPDGLCVSRGAVSRAGNAIVCVPAGIVIKIVSEDNSDADYDLAVG